MDGTSLFRIIKSIHRNVRYQTTILFPRLLVSSPLFLCAPLLSLYSLLICTMFLVSPPKELQSILSLRYKRSTDYRAQVYKGKPHLSIFKGDLAISQSNLNRLLCNRHISCHYDIGLIRFALGYTLSMKPNLWQYC